MLKGSVEKATVQNICDVDTVITKSIFDGEIFGMAEIEVEESADTYNYSVVATENCTMLKIPYK